MKRKLLLLAKENGISSLYAALKEVLDSNNVCYICLQKPYTDIIDEIRENGIDENRFFFIDALSRHFTDKPDTEKCSFISSPRNVDELKSALNDHIKGNGCNVVVFDKVSSLLLYMERSDITRLVNFIVSNIDSHIVLVSGIEECVEDESVVLADDLRMFVDETKDI